ncbi:1-acyl-sn-glycerol-3-phosphate acyltransferase [Ruminococcaceae bacterium OttesenSCG-928-I18]|nr:1-acyl-sn-glycerol-3-phosphate acyltransferase [Ruminococcaceae bacterium OttesenSCG-928-I18]
MLKTLFWACWLFLYMGVRIPLYWWLKHLRKQGREEEVRAVLAKQAPLWSGRLFRHTRTRIHVEGRENLPTTDQTVLFVSNHQSYLDIPLFFEVLGYPYPLMAKRELGKIPFLRSWMEMLDCIFVEREDIRAAAAAMKEAEEMLQSGRSLIVCPEGTRSMGDEMAEFKGGSVRMALRAGVPIVPLAVDGSYKILEGNDYRVQPAEVRFVVLPWVETEGLSREEQKALPGKLHDLIREAKDAEKKPALEEPEGQKTLGQ